MSQRGHARAGGGEFAAWTGPSRRELLEHCYRIPRGVGTLRQPEEEAAMAWRSIGGQLDQDIFDAVAGFLGELLQRGDELAKEFGIPVFCLKALHRLGTPLTMSELSEQLHYHRSFVTMIADTLEERGLAKREPHPVDRRIKNLVLTPDGIALKERLEAALAGRMPWSQALDPDEKASLLELVHKMTKAGTAPASRAGPAADESSLPSGGERAGEVSTTDTATSLGA